MPCTTYSTYLVGTNFGRLLSIRDLALECEIGLNNNGIFLDSRWNPWHFTHLSNSFKTNKTSIFLEILNYQPWSDLEKVYPILSAPGMNQVSNGISVKPIIKFQ